MSPAEIGNNLVLFPGDCLSVLPSIPDQSIDAVITDPPYPCIEREYGRWTEEEWAELMMGVVEHTRRILKPTGSAVFILQPNSERVGRMRSWLWHFMAWIADEWNMVQDVYWWNPQSQPNVHTQRKHGLMRPSLKPCVWAGNPDCYRDQSEILWQESDANKAIRESGRCTNKLRRCPSGYVVRADRQTAAAAERGGVTPFNLLPIPGGGSGPDSAGKYGHGAGTPMLLAQWWTRYICPPGGTVLDPFGGSGTMGIAAVREGRKAILIERMPGYVEIINSRLRQEIDATPLFSHGIATNMPAGIDHDHR